MRQHILSQLTSRVHWLSPSHDTDRPILGVVAGTRATLIIDAGNSPDHAQCLLDALAALDIPKPTWLALTHWHWDHVFGAATLGLPSFAHVETRRMITAMSQLDWSDAALDQRVQERTEIAFCRDMIKAELPHRGRLTFRQPEFVFDARDKIDLGDVTCQLVHVGGDHAHDSSIVYVPEEGIVFLGDCMYPDMHHGPDRYTTRRLFPLLDRLRGFPADTYVASHNDAPYSRAQFLEEAAMLETIGRLVTTHGEDRDATLSALRETFGAEANEAQRAVVDAFVAGSHPPTA